MAVLLLCYVRYLVLLMGWRVGLRFEVLVVGLLALPAVVLSAPLVRHVLVVG